MTPWTAAHQASLSSTISWSLLKFMSIESVMLSKQLIQLSPLLLFALNLSQYRGLFQWVGSLHQVAKVWSFIFSNSPSNGYLRLISCKIDWFDLLSVQGTLRSLLQHHSSKVSVLWCLDYTSLCRQCLLFNSLSLSYERMIDDLKLWVAVFQAKWGCEMSFPSK